MGKRADLILAAANPLDDPANMFRTAGVMVNGRWLPRRELDEMLVEIENALRYPPAAEIKDLPIPATEAAALAGRYSVEKINVTVASKDGKLTLTAHDPKGDRTERMRSQGARRVPDPRGEGPDPVRDEGRPGGGADRVAGRGAVPGGPGSAVASMGARRRSGQGGRRRREDVPDPKPAPGSFRVPAGLLPAVAVAASLLFAGAVGHPFVWDDKIHLLDNPHLNPPTWAGLRALWAAPFEDLYSPLVYTVWAALAAVARGADGVLSPWPVSRALPGASRAEHAAGVLCSPGGCWPTPGPPPPERPCSRSTPCRSSPWCGSVD